MEKSEPTAATKVAKSAGVKPKKSAKTNSEKEKKRAPKSAKASAAAPECVIQPFDAVGERFRRPGRFNALGYFK